jgi:uncharacterized protein YbaR (Trm112 family)
MNETNTFSVMNYLHCPHCRKRMKVYAEDKDGERRFYYCPACGSRGAFYPMRNAWGNDWSSEIWERAITEGLYNREGVLLS